jgi:glycerol-3-phosphate dehydrogenase (NAD(P)+)
MARIGIVGAGSFGTSLAVHLTNRGHDVSLVVRDPEKLAAMQETRSNERYLPGVKFSDRLKLYPDNESGLEGSDIIIFAAPAQSFRNAFEHAIPFIDDDTVVVNVAKGIEEGTLMRMSQVAKILKPDVKYAALSGPSHAEELGRGMPTTMVSCSDDEETAKYVQDVFSSEALRVYTNDDMVGVEIGGALKNVIALGAGISDGIGYGDNAKAALMTRGIAEMKRLGVKLGAKEATFLGLTGIGDLIVTCTSMHSRNRRCGIMIGEGIKPSEAVKRVGMVVEGMTTVVAAKQLAEQNGVEMPITESIYKCCIEEAVTPKEAVIALMTRDKKNEMD